MSETNGTSTVASATPFLEPAVSTSHGRAGGAPRMIGATQHGFLVLADISGFTAFVTTTELEHGPPIIAALLEEVIRRISPPLEIQEIEGDAVFALDLHDNVVPPAALLGVLHEALVGFRSLQREMQADESCTCNACRSIWRLRLKLIGHYGAFLRQTVGGRVQAAGKEVILAHLLLKNQVPRKTDYVLLTRPALHYMDVDPGPAGLSPHTERYEYFGDVECFVGHGGGV
jgi:uncharacterized protein DUF2652